MEDFGRDWNMWRPRPGVERETAPQTTGGDVSQGYGDIVQYSSCPRIRLSRNQYAITAANREKRRSHAARKQPLIIH